MMQSMRWILLASAATQCAGVLVFLHLAWRDKEPTALLMAVSYAAMMTFFVWIFTGIEPT